MGLGQTANPKSPSWTTWSRRHFLLFLILVASMLLRIELVLRGGQLFWGDEDRFARSATLLALLVNGKLRGALDLLLQNQDHTGFIVVGAIPTLIQTIAVGVSPALQTSLWVPAAVLATASLACIALTYAIAIQVGGAIPEATIAAGLMAASCVMLYFARHLLPYDGALALLLLALWIGLDKRSGVWRSLVCGVLAGLGFLTYNGYWAMALTVLCIHVFYGTSPIQWVKRGAFSGAGFLLLPLLLTVISILKRTYLYIALLATFANTASQGLFAEGWSLPWEYFWQAEHLTLVVWLIGSALAIYYALRGARPTRRAALWWLGGAVLIYILLTLGSTGLGRFVVYGRLARQMVPFLCLATAFSAWQLYENLSFRLPKLVVPLVITLFVLEAGLNLFQPFTQQFPLDAIARASKISPSFAREITVQGPDVQGGLLGASSGYVLLNAQQLYPVEGKKAAPSGQTVFCMSHPLQFLPYQYEGWNPTEREILRSTDISMCLLDLRAEASQRRRACPDDGGPIEWKFATNALGWEAWNDLTDYGVQNGVLSMKVVGPDPEIGGPVIDVPQERLDHLEIRLGARAQDNHIQGSLYWQTGAMQDFSPAEKVLFEVQANTAMETYELKLSPHEKGNIVRLRLDPSDKPALVEIESIKISCRP